MVNNHQEKLVKLLDLYVEHVHNKFNKYAFYFFLCELLNIVITAVEEEGVSVIFVVEVLLKWTRQVKFEW